MINSDTLQKFDSVRSLELRLTQYEGRPVDYELCAVKQMRTKMDMPRGQSSYLELVDALFLDMRHGVIKILDRIVKREKRENLKLGRIFQTTLPDRAVQHRDIGRDLGSKAN